MYRLIRCTLVALFFLVLWPSESINLRFASVFFFSSSSVVWFCLAPVSLIIVSEDFMSFAWRNQLWWVYIPKGFSNMRCLIIGAALLGLESSHWGTWGVKTRRVCDLNVSQQSSPWGTTVNSSLTNRVTWLDFLCSLNTMLWDSDKFLFTCFLVFF